MNYTSTMQTKTNGRSLPKGWQWAKLGNVCEIIMGQSPEGNTYNSLGEGVPLLNGPTEFGNRYPTPIQWTTSPTRFAEKDDILFCVRGATTGRKNIADQKYCIGRGLAAIRATPNKTDREFLYYLLDTVTSELLNETAGSIFPNLSGDKLQNFIVSLPPLGEQRGIASRLNEQLAAVESARKAAEEQIAAAWELPSAYLREVFESEEAMKWNKVRLGDLASSGPSNGIFKRRHEFGRGTPLINVSDLFRTMAIDLSELERVETSSKELAHYGVKSGDLFFCRSSIKREGVGWCAYLSELPEPAVFDSHVMRLTPDKSRVLTEYIAYYWQLPQVRKAVIENAKTATMTTMNQGDLTKVEIPLAPIIEQKRIVQYLSDKFAHTKSAVHNLESQLAEIESLPASLLREAFSGNLSWEAIA